MKRGFIGALCLSVTFTLLAGCGGSQPPIGAPGVMPQTSAIMQNAARGKSWMLPEASGEDLLYLSTTGGNVFIYSYERRKHVATLNLGTSAFGECSDQKGDVFITAAGPSDGGIIYEYPHGSKKPVATLIDPGYPSGCSVDSVSGDLAVANYHDHNNVNGNGDLAIYANATGSPTLFSDPNIANMLFCGYDLEGNLFVDGSAGSFRFAELAKGENVLTDISVMTSIKYGGAVQWDGQNMTIAAFPSSSGPLTVYRVEVSGSTATVVGSTLLKSKRNEYAGQLWINGNTIIGPMPRLRAIDNIGYWAYPSGGKPTRQIKKVGPGLWA